VPEFVSDFAPGDPVPERRWLAFDAPENLPKPLAAQGRAHGTTAGKENDIPLNSRRE